MIKTTETAEREGKINNIEATWKLKFEKSFSRQIPTANIFS
jgi:hypothetical protein